MSAYYNEHDPYAAQWLRNLIDAGHIPAGDVDERDIRDVRAADIAGYRQCHFFAGIGGWSLAARLAGWPDDRPMWTGSCPCQPFSVAGKRTGTADERHLWPEFARLIGERQPAIVFGEQVPSLDGRKWFAGVRADLEAMGYAVGCADLCAASVGEEATLIGDDAECVSCGKRWDYCACVVPGPFTGAEKIVIGAPHIRQRLWWVADVDGRIARYRDLQRGGQYGQQSQDGWATGGMGDAGGAGLQACERETLRGAQRRDEGRAIGQSSRACISGMEHAEGEQTGVPRQPRQQRNTAERMEHTAGDGRQQRRTESSGRGAIGGCREDAERMGDAECGGQQGEQRRQPMQQPAHASMWSDFDVVICTDQWPDGAHKARRIEPGSQPLAHGVPNRVGKLRAFGNAIVPQVAAEVIKAMLR